MARPLYVLVDPAFLKAISLGGRGINDFLSHLVRQPCTGVTTQCVLQNLPWDLSDEDEYIMYGLEPFSSCNHGISSIEECFTALLQKGLPDLAFATPNFRLSNVLRGVSAGVKIVEPPAAAPPAAEKPKRKAEAQHAAGKLKGKEKMERGDVTDQGKVEAQPAAEKLKSKERKRKRCRKGRGTRGTMKLSRLLLWNV